MGDLAAAAGLLAAAFAAAASIVWDRSPRRAAAMLIALALIPVLILGDQWNSAEVGDLRDDPARFALLIAGASAVVGVLALVFRRRPLLAPLALIAAIPFRVPIDAGAEDVNLLIPLYLVIGGAVLASAWGMWEDRGGASTGDGGGGDPRRAEAAPPAEHGGGASAGRTRGRAVQVVLALVLVLYALQSLYSEDFSRALQNVAFFYVPFALAFVLLSDRRWDRRLLALAIGVLAAEALAFALFGFWEYATRHLIWNPEVMRSNEFHTYFRVNSLFWDPNVYGRYLALTIIALTTTLLWARNPRLVAATGAVAVLLWLGLVTTFSQSSFAALVVGLAALAALRWSVRWTLLACAAGALGAAAFLLAAGGSLRIDLSTERKINKDTSGRANLVSEGIALFGDRPLWGYGSGSFSAAYQEHRSGGGSLLSVSHTEPVTVAAEQGLLGLAAYIAVLAAAFATLLGGIWGAVPGARGPPPEGLAPITARVAVVACFAGLITHTMAYAGFLEDPLTWVLLAIGASLAAARQAA